MLEDALPSSKRLVTSVGLSEKPAILQNTVWVLAGRGDTLS